MMNSMQEKRYAKKRRRVVLFAALIWVLLCGFDYSKHSIPVDEIFSGGPPKDGIPALFNPKFISARKAGKNFLKDQDRVLGLYLNGKAKAYPIKILNWHEIVNDQVGGRSVVVTFCPLCGTGMVFDAVIKGRRMSFGVSGLLYQSDMLLYDHKTESLWSQIKSEAVTGPMTGAKLKLLATTQTTWKKWREMHPDTRVLSLRTGYRRDYNRDPYKGYDTTAKLMFGVSNRNRSYHPKEKVVGIELGGAFKAYPFSELAKAERPLKDVIRGTEVRVDFDPESKTAVVLDKNGRELPSVVGFWFAWYAFHPDTEIFTESKP